MATKNSLFQCLIEEKTLFEESKIECEKEVNPNLRKQKIAWLDSEIKKIEKRLKLY